MNKRDVVKIILQNRTMHTASESSGAVFAPTNIALCKYWGKRDQELNLPVTSSLSISLGQKGTTTTIIPIDLDKDVVLLNHEPVAMESGFYRRIVELLDLFASPRQMKFRIETQTNIPTAAGLASSASGFAAFVCALDQLFGWSLSSRDLSLLARLGSGSACRSIWQGFVEWQLGERADGMDSHGVPLSDVWPELCIGLLIVSTKKKYISSRIAMQRTVTTSPFYSRWPTKVSADLVDIKQAISEHDFALLGKSAESNAMAMHATMLSAWPPVSYALPETMLAMQQVWALREQGLPLYFTQDAGPNLKLIFLQQDIDVIKEHFATIEIVQPFSVLKEGVKA